MRNLLTVDVDDLAASAIAASRMRRSTPMRLEYLERTRLHSNGFRVLRRRGQRIDDAAGDAAAGQFDGGGEADRAGTGDQHLRSAGMPLMAR